MDIIDTTLTILGKILAPSTLDKQLCMRSLHLQLQKQVFNCGFTTSNSVDAEAYVNEPLGPKLKCSGHGFKFMFLDYYYRLFPMHYRNIHPTQKLVTSC